MTTDGFRCLAEHLPHSIAAYQGTRAVLGFVQSLSDGVKRHHVDSFGKAGFAADEAFQLGVKWNGAYLSREYR